MPWRSQHLRSDERKKYSHYRPYGTITVPATCARPCAVSRSSCKETKSRRSEETRTIPSAEDISALKQLPCRIFTRTPTVLDTPCGEHPPDGCESGGLRPSTRWLHNSRRFSASTAGTLSASTWGTPMSTTTAPFYSWDPS